MSKKEERVIFKCSKDFKDKIERKAKEVDISLSSYIRMILSKQF